MVVHLVGANLDKVEPMQIGMPVPFLDIRVLYSFNTLLTSTTQPITTRPRSTGRMLVVFQVDIQKGVKGA